MSDPGLYAPLSRWDDLSNGDLMDNMLHQIASDICTHHRVYSDQDIPYADDDGDNREVVPTLLTVEDIGLWRVRVLVS
jgi:hypothetical protein